MREVSMEDLFENELQNGQANDALEDQPWWVEGVPWYFQDQRKLREWHDHLVAGLKEAGHGRRS